MERTPLLGYPARLNPKEDFQPFDRVVLRIQLGDESQSSSETIISLCLHLPPEHLIASSQTHVQRGKEVLHPLVLDGICVFQGKQVPCQRIFEGVLATRQVMCGNAGCVMIGTGIPCPLIEEARFIESIFQFSPYALDAECDDGIVGIHGVLMLQ